MYYNNKNTLELSYFFLFLLLTMSREGYSNMCMLVS
jgi:hypothetical protein